MPAFLFIHSYLLMGIFNTEQEEKVFNTLHEHIESMGFELLKIRTSGGKSSKKLQLVISRLNGEPIAVSDCESVSNHASVLFDVENPLNCEYDLEVSSPGLDRPLVKPQHFKDVCGKNVILQSKFYIKDRRNFKGKLESADDEKIFVAVDGTKEPFEIPYDAILDANLIYEDEQNSNSKKRR